LNAFSQI